MNAPHRLPITTEAEVDITTEDILWYNICYYITKACMTLLYDIRSIDAWQVPATGSVLLLPNHTSFYDPPAVGITMQRRSFYLARKTLFKNRFFSKLIKSINAIPIDQRSAGMDGIRHSITLREPTRPCLWDLACHGFPLWAYDIPRPISLFLTAHPSMAPNWPPCHAKRPCAVWNPW